MELIWCVFSYIMTTPWVFLSNNIWCPIHNILRLMWKSRYWYVSWKCWYMTSFLLILPDIQFDSPYNEPYSGWVFLLWSHINYYAWICYHSSHWYIVACEKKNSVCPFFQFSWKSVWKLSKLFSQSVLSEVSYLFYFYCIRYFYCSIYPLTGSITTLTRY